MPLCIGSLSRWNLPTIVIGNLLYYNKFISKFWDIYGTAQDENVKVLNKE